MEKIEEKRKAIQDYYPEKLAKCFGCGRTNTDGLHHKTYWDGNEGTCHFIPQKHHTGYPGVLYGGLVASLIECNSVAVSIAATCEAEGINMEKPVKLLFFTIVRSNIKFHSAVPINSEITIKTKVDSMNKKFVKIKVSIYSDNKLCTTAETTTMRMEQALETLESDNLTAI